MGNIRNLLLELKSKSIDIVLNDGELEVFFDGDDLDPIIYNQIKDNKNELIQFLKNPENDVNNSFSIPTTPFQDNYPLSSSQSRLWMASQFEGGNSAYNVSGAYQFDGVLDIKIIELSFQFLIERHESLRTIFKENSNGEIRQYILNSEGISFKIEYEVLPLEYNSEILNAKIKEEFEKSFNLSEGLLIRVKLFKIAENKHIFSLVMHHIISDGWSMEVMVKELFTFYKSSIMEEIYPFEPLRIQYKDYAVWQQDQLKGPRYSEFKEYWLTQLDDIPVLNLPTQKQRPAIKTFNGVTQNKIINKTLLEGLKEISRLEGGTLFMSLLSTVNALFYKYTEQQDIVIGSAIAGREYADLDNQIGFFVNALPLRTRFNKDNSFIQVLRKVKETALAAYEYQAYPLDELSGDLALKRDMSRNALFDVMVDLQSSYGLYNEDINENVGDFIIKPYTEIKVTKSRFDLHFNFFEIEEGLYIELNYNIDIYSNEFMTQLLAHFEQLFEEIVRTPTIPISTIDCLNNSEKEKLLLHFNDTLTEYPKNNTIIDLFEQQVEKTPDALAIVFGNTELSYQKLNERANQLAFYLRDKYSILPNDLIGIRMDKSDQFIVIILAILKSGAAYLPIDPNYPQERIDYIQNDSMCKIIIDEEELMLYNFERFRYGMGNPDKTNTSSDLAYVIYTSGSTGQPKGVLVEHHSNINMSL
ncbi:non-ribosomal peptide synthetase, partial [Chryseobacterium sp. SIMBA_029]|uniref:non-ribosomal peptide synthetase n=1 Tax=Chryseobacterium sp. SIMBA_029 TaxID=3085772 RepID=UPI00397A0D6D